MVREMRSGGGGGLLLIESIPAGAHLEGAEKQPEILILSEKEQ
ncbi:hypothetical protein FOQG_02423 [Fusarium oxysporum f. sp. raphani 54005]|uniref:Uncharacterized protein n=1 Tax=Fusarium oxysporum f. sp. raphani 54005 TaxID=1089458 RepID=X0DS53_FUSOX|nr:hypothetical protein FOQG_02423 [Fusarium oxysporum f. sp. raphani 54005]